METIHHVGQPELDFARSTLVDPFDQMVDDGDWSPEFRPSLEFPSVEPGKRDDGLGVDGQQLILGRTQGMWLVHLIGQGGTRVNQELVRPTIPQHHNPVGHVHSSSVERQQNRGRSQPSGPT